MTLTRHVYSAHIDVASLSWWKTLDQAQQEMIQQAMYEAAVYQRADNRAKDDARLTLLKENGMEVVEDPDLDAMRAQVADLKDIDLFKDEKIQTLLLKVLQATN